MNRALGRHWLASSRLLLALVLSAGASAQTQSAADKSDGPLGESSVSWQAEQYWGGERYQELEEMFSRLANPAERLTDGRWRLAANPNGFAHHFEVHKNRCVAVQLHGGDLRRAVGEGDLKLLSRWQSEQRR